MVLQKTQSYIFIRLLPLTVHFLSTTGFFAILCSKHQPLALKCALQLIEQLLNWKLFLLSFTTVCLKIEKSTGNRGLLSHLLISHENESPFCSSRLNFWGAVKVCERALPLRLDRFKPSVYLFFKACLSHFVLRVHGCLLARFSHSARLLFIPTADLPWCSCEALYQSSLCSPFHHHVPTDDHNPMIWVSFKTSVLLTVYHVPWERNATTSFIFLHLSFENLLPSTPVASCCLCGLGEALSSQQQPGGDGAMAGSVTWLAWRQGCSAAGTRARSLVSAGPPAILYKGNRRRETQLEINWVLASGSLWLWVSHFISFNSCFLTHQSSRNIVQKCRELTSLQKSVE